MDSKEEKEKLVEHLESIERLNGIFRFEAKLIRGENKHGWPEEEIIVGASDYTTLYRKWDIPYINGNQFKHKFKYENKTYYSLAGFWKRWEDWGGKKEIMSMTLWNMPQVINKIHYDHETKQLIDMKEWCRRLGESPYNTTSQIFCPYCHTVHNKQIEMEFSGWMDYWVDFGCPDCGFFISFRWDYEDRNEAREDGYHYKKEDYELVDDGTEYHLISKKRLEYMKLMKEKGLDVPEVRGF